MTESKVTKPSVESASDFRIEMSRLFVAWMTSQQIGVAFTTYQGKLFLLGHNGRGGCSVFERTFERAMGLAGDSQTLYLASLFQIWRLENVLESGQQIDGYDRLYVPQAGYTTGDLDIHDVAVESDGRPVFISSRFSCVATVSQRYSFKALWVPPFISRLAAEDRCHLNGLAVVDGKARYVTACARTDVVDGWREYRGNGGCVIDIETNNVLLTGLSMPHSPRWYRKQLWLLESGTGYLGYLDQNGNKFERVTFCPGYCRGLSFVGDYAVVGLSLPRYEPTFTGLDLEANLRSKKGEARCGLLVIELATGEIVHWVRLSEPIRELYEVLVLPGVVRPMAFGFKSDEIRTRVWADPEGLIRCK